MAAVKFAFHLFQYLTYYPNIYYFPPPPSSSQTHTIQAPPAEQPRAQSPPTTLRSPLHVTDALRFASFLSATHPRRPISLRYVLFCWLVLFVQHNTCRSHWNIWWTSSCMYICMMITNSELLWRRSFLGWQAFLSNNHLFALFFCWCQIQKCLYLNISYSPSPSPLYLSCMQYS